MPSRKKDRFLFAHLFRDITKRMRILGLAEELHTLLATLWRSPPRRHHAAPEHRKPPSVVPDIPTDASSQLTGKRSLAIAGQAQGPRAFFVGLIGNMDDEWH
jgi:hypothetical protein